MPSATSATADDPKPHATLSAPPAANSVLVPPETPLAALLPALLPEHASLTLLPRPLPPSDVSLLTVFLSTNKHVTHLSLAGLSLPDHVSLQLLTALATHAHPPSPLRALSLRAVGLSASGASRLAALLADADLGALQTLDLSNNSTNWPGEHALRLAVAARARAALPHLLLDLSGNQVLIELLNAATHGLGALLALAAGLVLTVAAARRGLPPATVAALAVFAAALLTLLTSSCVYHSAFRCPAASRRLRKADHCSIFLLIAGTYTPFVVSYTLHPPTVAGPATLLAVWLCASVGVARSLAESGSNRTRALLALATGWLGIFSVRTMAERMQQDALRLVVMGGLAYSIGIIFYLMGKKRPMMHVVWHVAVMLGGGLHYYALWRYVVNG